MAAVAVQAGKYDELARKVEKLELAVYKFAALKGVSLNQVPSQDDFTSEEEEHTVPPEQITALGTGWVDHGFSPVQDRAVRKRSNDMHQLGRDIARKFNPHYKGTN